MSRKLDLSQFRGDDSDEEQQQFIPKKILKLDELKSRTFSHGITKKSKKDLEKEAEEKKRIEEEKAAALALAEWDDAFEGRTASSSIAGARGGFGRGFGKPGGGFVRAGGTAAYEPPTPSVSSATIASVATSSIPPKGPSAMGYARPHRVAPFKEPSPPLSAAPKSRGKRAMDKFLEEIKGNQVAREQRLGKIAQQEGSSVTALAAWEGSGGRPAAEAETTNLFVSNLPSNISEESLGLFFAKHGPVGTVKIMWPRGDEDTSIGASISSTRRAKPGLQGFVSYMKRSDAEKAVEELNGIEWGGSLIRVGWSKPVPVPLRALYDLGTSSRESRERSASPIRRRRDRDRESSSRSPPRKRDRSDSRSPPRRKRSNSYSSASSYSRSPSRSPPPKKLNSRDRWLAKVPDEQRKFIRAVATRVREHGKGLEGVLKEKEKDNPKFQFLSNDKLPEYHVYQLAISSRHRVPTPPPDDFEDEGYASLYSSDSAEESEKERGTRGKMGKLARKRLEAILRAMSGKRVEIARAMEFALKRAEAADDIAEVICQSLKVDGTPVPRKMARLHLVSDILHNSASPLPNVWKYRLAFEQRLLPVFAHLSGVRNSLEAYSGRISADVFRAQVAAVLDIWERWIVFTSDVSDRMRNLFNGSQTLEPTPTPLEEGPSAPIEQPAIKAKPEKGFKTSGFKSSFKPLAAVSAPAAPAEYVDGEPLAATEAADVDGEPLASGEGAEDVDGEDMDMDLDGEPAEDLDGEVLGDMDGEPIEEDVDGEALS
ncbi:hypothetical protein BCR39DRAFT_541703 [Naematelia encephala]|uniref:U2-associated protein SR140 n=1 Tax=Naematelia encephala TaxID=71784 RepID=A0A1Y2AUN3_9TREE|nr:hypothetical protein BCR39DRAFT_541703 [Naematelia encephala]